MKNKIYITALHLQHGGVEMAITLLSNALVKRGCDVEILCTYNLGQPAYKLDSRVTVTYLTNLHPNRNEFKQALHEKKLGRLVSEAVYALRVLRAKQTTLIVKFREIREGTVISTRNEHSVLLSQYGNANVKKIAQLHHDHQFDKRLLRDFKRNYGNIDYFTLLTDQLRDEVREIMAHNTHTKVLTVPNFLEELPEQPPRKPVRQAIAVGRLHSVKGFDRLIRLWAKLNCKEPVTLKIIGEGEERPKLEALIREYGLEDKVILTGAMDHALVLENMNQSQIYLMTSHSEGFPFVLIEAMSAGLPVVAYDVRVGPRAIIQEGISGFLVEDGLEDAFCQKVTDIFENEALRRDLSRGALDRSRVFSEENIMQIWRSILEA